MNTIKYKILLMVVLTIITVAVVGGLIFLQSNSENNEDEYEEIGLSAFEERFGQYTPEMWVVEDEETGNKMYVFGSIHVGIADMYPLPERILTAFRESDVLAVENDVRVLEEDMILMMELMTHFTYADGTTLRDNTAAEQLAGLQEMAMAYGVPILPDAAFNKMYYMMLISTMMWDSLGYTSEYGIEMYLMEEAERLGMRIEDIEDPLYTFSLLGGLSDEVMISALMTELESFRNGVIEEEAHALFKAWVTGTVSNYYEMMYEEIYEEYGEEGVQLFEEYMLALNYIRNEIMAERAVEFLESGEQYFFVVGALHLQGERGVIRLLQEKGFSVERVV